MPQLSQQSSPPLTSPPMTTNGPTNNRTRSPVYLDIENSRSMMNIDETVGTSPSNHNNNNNGRTTMVQFDNFVVDDDVDDVVDDVDDDDKTIIRSAKGQLIDFNLFYENLLANHHHHHNHHQAHHHHRHHHHHDLYALNSATFFNESLNYCLNKVCNGKHHDHHDHHQHNHHQRNHHQNGLANNETNNNINNIGNINNNNNNNNNKSFSIDSILGFAAAAAVARQDLAKDPINDGDVVLYGHQPKLMHSMMHGNQSVLYHHQQRHQQQQHHQTTTISAKKLSNEAHHHHHHHLQHHNNCLKQNDQKLKGNSNGNGNSNKKIGASKKCMKAIGNNNDDKNFVGHNVGHNPNNKSKRIRTIFTPEQLERLEIEFEKQQYMVGTGRLYLASTLNLTEAQVKVWFQNRRIKWRKQHLEGYQDTTAVATIIKDQQKMMANDVVDDHAKPIMAT